MKFNKKEVYAALLLLIIAIPTTLGSLNYDIRTLARMGPGYYPLLLGASLIIVALLILFSPSEDHEESEEVPDEGSSPHYRVWGLVSIGMILFIILGKFGGLIPATFALIFVSALADRANTIPAAAVLAAAVTVFAVAVFHYGLRMQLPLFTWG